MVIYLPTCIVQLSCMSLSPITHTKHTGVTKESYNKLSVTAVKERLLLVIITSMITGKCCTVKCMMLWAYVQYLHSLSHFSYQMKVNVIVTGSYTATAVIYEYFRNSVTVEIHGIVKHASCVSCIIVCTNNSYIFILTYLLCLVYIIISSNFAFMSQRKSNIVWL